MTQAIDPLAVYQEGGGQIATDPVFLTARWPKQFIGAVFPQLDAMPAAAYLTLQTNPHSTTQFDIATNVIMTAGVDGVPSGWPYVTSSEFTPGEMVTPGEALLIPLPLVAEMTAGVWGVVLNAAEARGDNLQAIPGTLGLVVETGEPGEPPPPVDPQEYRFTIDRPFVAGDTVILEAKRDGRSVAYVRVVV